MCTAYGRLYIGVTKTVRVVWVCRRFDHRPTLAVH